jgi:hypothetical protein
LSGIYNAYEQECCSPEIWNSIPNMSNIRVVPGVTIMRIPPLSSAQSVTPASQSDTMNLSRPREVIHE